MTTSYKTYGTSIFASALNGIKSSYYYLLQDKSGLTLDNILNPSKEDKQYAYMNYNFSSYLASNFSKLDTDGDGKITEDELNMYSNKMTMSGMTYDELVQLCAQNGSNSLLQTVLDNFAEVDANGDGRVTSAEIAGYKVSKDKEEMEEKHPKTDVNAMSIFYDTSASKTAETTKTKEV